MYLYKSPPLHPDSRVCDIKAVIYILHKIVFMVIGFRPIVIVHTKLVCIPYVYRDQAYWIIVYTVSIKVHKNTMCDELSFYLYHVIITSLRGAIG